MAVKVTTHHRCDHTELFVEANDYDDRVPNWRRVPIGDAGDRKVIRCARCDRPATMVDAHWPWMTDATRCAEHSDFKKFPLDG